MNDVAFIIQENIAIVTVFDLHEITYNRIGLRRLGKKCTNGQLDSEVNRVISYDNK